jgi:hypothetical protein
MAADDLIEINSNECAQAVLLGGDGKAERQCGFACSTFLGYEGNSLHVVKMVVYLHPAANYHRLTRPTFTGAKRPR